MGFLRHKNINKEVRMKKFIVIAIAVLLAIPAVSFAGSATSRWDLTLGGYVEFDMGWADRGTNADYATAPRKSFGVWENREAEFASEYAAGAAGRLWWIVKGPDAFGAKTGAYVEGDFRGQTGDYGEFNLRHAFMKLEWANDSFQIGRQWQRWGAHFPFGGWLLAFSGLGPSLKGQRNEAIVWDHKFAKDWGFYLGVYHNSSNDMGGRALDDYANSPYPFIEGGIKYTSESCGRIGNQIMMFDVGGFLGWERNIWSYADPVLGGNFYDDDLAQAWGLALKYYVPIIPERKGNKAGALGIGGNLFMGQNLSWYGGIGAVQYAPGTATTDPRLSYPHQWGGWFQIDYFFTDALSIHGWYSHAENNYSKAASLYLAPLTAVKKNQQYIVNLFYDMNAAMRFGVEYAYINTKYANYLWAPGGFPVAGKKGDMNTVRIGAWYFF